LNKALKILISPLDWGLGHTTRCIPIIAYLREQGAEVIIAANDRSINLLREEFSDIRCVSLRGYEITYSKHSWALPIKLFFQLPKIINRIIGEHYWLKKFVKLEEIDFVISDNRYGMYSTKVPSIFLTHQLQIQVPQSKILFKIVRAINFFFIKKFAQCWIVDYPDIRMAGVLSENTNLSICQYIGNLSRFEKQKVTSYTWDLVCILSGPEPQRTLLEKALINQTKGLLLKVLIVRGLPGETEQYLESNVEIVNHVPSYDLEIILQHAKVIITRSGYSTVMDLIKLNRHAIIIPTPGQTEQEYLGKYLHDKKWMMAVHQDGINVTNAIKEFEQFAFDAYPNFNFELFKSVLDKL